MNEKLLKPYDPKNTEERIYKIWEESGFFNPDVCVDKGITIPNAKTFTLIMPPTNANGSLHAGHGLVMTIEDIIVRYKRMRGFKTLWLPGLDHAGFETQVVYEKKLEKEGKTRFDVEPKQLYKDILEFTLNNSTNIKSQIKKMGASCDWSREAPIFLIWDFMFVELFKVNSRISLYSCLGSTSNLVLPSFSSFFSYTTCVSNPA